MEEYHKLLRWSENIAQANKGFMSSSCGGDTQLQEMPQIYENSRPVQMKRNKARTHYNVTQSVIVTRWHTTSSSLSFKSFIVFKFKKHGSAMQSNKKWSNPKIAKNKEKWRRGKSKRAICQNKQCWLPLRDWTSLLHLLRKLKLSHLFQECCKMQTGNGPDFVHCQRKLEINKICLN